MGRYLLVIACFSCLYLEARLQKDYKRWERHIEVEGDFVYISKAQFRDQTITYDPTNTNTDVITTRSLGHRVGFSPGFQGSLGFRLASKHLVTASVLMLAEPWRARKNYANPTQLSFPFNSSTVPYAFNSADSSMTKWHGDFWQTGLEYTYEPYHRRNHQFFFQGLFGTKFIYYAESLNVGFTRSGHTGQYSIHTRNDLYGGTIGIRVGYFFLRCLEWSMGGRVGLFANAAKCSGYLNDLNGAVLIRKFDHHKWKAAGLFEGFVAVKFYPTSFIDISIQYFGEKIPGLADTANNINRGVGPSQPIKTTGYTVIDGLIAGITLSY